MKQIWLNRKYIFRKSWQISGSVYAIIGLAGLLANLDDLIFPSFQTWIRVLIGIAILLVLFGIILFFCCMHCKNKSKISVLKVLNGHNIYVQYGNLFDEDIACDNNGKPSKEKRNIVIPVNCCFDTIVDDDLVSSTKIHGMALRSLYESGKYTPDSLNQLIQNDLCSRAVEYRELSKAEKRKGNLRRYPFGTVVEVNATDNIKYFLIALTEFEQNLHAEIHNREIFVIVLQRLIEYISSRSQGMPTVMPIIGGGLPEVSDCEQSILELMIDLISINKDKINCDYHIVVRDSGRDEISILGL